MPKILFQGELGANSHIACTNVYPDYEVVPKATFAQCFAGMQNGDADLAMIPIENSVAGRVGDVHHFIPDAGLYIIGEYFLPIHHQLLALKGSKLEEIKEVQSHIMALTQCRSLIDEYNFSQIVAADTAGSARQIKEYGDKSRAAIATSLAAEIYDLDVIKHNVEDKENNTTRFLILSREPDFVRYEASAHDDMIITSFVFKVDNIPAALYKCLGGFATNGVNMTKLESYQHESKFEATQFYADIQGHPDEPAVIRALKELTYFTEDGEGAKVLGVYAGDKNQRRS